MTFTCWVVVATGVVVVGDSPYDQFEESLQGLKREEVEGIVFTRCSRK